MNLEPNLRLIFSKYLKYIRSYIIEYKVKFQLDDIALLLEQKEFDILNLITYLDQEDATRHISKILKTNNPKQSNTHSMNLNRHRLSLDGANYIQPQRFNTERKLDSPANGSQRKKPLFTYNKIQQELKQNIVQFKKNSQTLKFIEDNTREITVNYSKRVESEDVLMLKKSIQILQNGSPNKNILKENDISQRQMTIERVPIEKQTSLQTPPNRKYQRIDQRLVKQN
ncbi:hypothetical protein pb186bvf_013295 [Paramecium bursaria]